MGTNTRDLLYQQVKAVSEQLKLIDQAIDNVDQASRREAIAEIAVRDGFIKRDAADAWLDLDDEDDLPGFDLHDYLMDYSLEVVDQRGREYAVVIETGGPHIEVVADGSHDARLEGYWGGENVTLTGEYLNTFLDYHIDRD